MSLFSDMKDRLGFGEKPEWQDDGYSDGTYDENYDAPEDDGYYEDNGQGAADADPQDSADVISFSAYNPNNFSSVKLNSDVEPRVASYGSASGSGYGSISRNTSYSTSRSSRRSYGDSSTRSFSSDDVPTWDTPADPSFLVSRGPSSDYGRQVLDEIGATKSGHAANDPYSEFDSDVKSIHRDPAAHLSIIHPVVYGDVEKIATAAKAGKTVVVVLTETKPELAKRILDFSFGVASALNHNVDKAADRVFVFYRGSEMLSKAERDYLRKKDILK